MIFLGKRLSKAAFLTSNASLLGWMLLHTTPALMAQSSSASPAKEAVLKPTENLKIEGIPEIPVSMVERVRRYTEARGASFLDWHPTERSMLISTRFANSNQVHKVAMPGGARYQLTFFSEPVGSASYEPKSGSYYLFTKDVGGNEFAQLYRADLATGDSTLLSDGGRSQNGGIQWNNAKTLVCYGSTRRNGADRDLWILDPTKPQEQRIVMENKGGGWSVQDWSPNDEQILVMESLSVNKTNLYVVDVKTGKSTPITDQNAEVAYGGATFATDGASVYLTTDGQGEYQQLARLNLANKKIELLTGDIPWDVEAFRQSYDGKSLAVSINEAGVSKLYLIDVSSGKRREVTDLPVGVFSLEKWRSDDSEFAVTVTSAKSSSDVYSIDAKSLKATRWTTSELGGLNPDELSPPELVEWKSFDGQKISGFLYMPPKKFAGKRPVIINIHGGPEGQSRPNFLGRSNYLLNELGCAILFPNVRGSTGYGKTFVKLDNGLKRLDSVKDIGSLLDWIADSPNLDSQRIMITGGSYGGYMTLACAVEYDSRIACSLDVVGISHFATFLKNTESYRRDLRRVEYGDERQPEIAAFFEEMAPLNNSHRIKKPLFVVQGGNDPRVPLSEAEQIVAKVKSNGSPVWYLMANDEGHGFRKKNNADFQFYATVVYVEQYLLKDAR